MKPLNILEGREIDIIIDETGDKKKRCTQHDGHKRPPKGFDSLRRGASPLGLMPGNPFTATVSPRRYYPT